MDVDEFTKKIMSQTRDLMRDSGGTGKVMMKAVLEKCYPLVRSVFRFYCNLADGNSDQSMFSQGVNFSAGTMSRLEFYKCVEDTGVMAGGTPISAHVHSFKPSTRLLCISHRHRKDRKPSLRVRFLHLSL